MYHYINFLFLLAVVPLETIISSSATCKTIYKSLPLLTKLCIDKSSQLNIKVARRFRDVKEIRINSLLSSTVIEEFLEGGTLREVNLDFQSAHRVISYLSQFDKLENVYFGVTDADNDGKVIQNFCPADQWFWEGDESYPNEGSREEMFRFLDNVSIGYSSGALSKHVHISGLCCPETTGQRRGFGLCDTCSRACKTFPLSSVLTFESRGSSSSSALSNRSYSLDCCLSRAEIESILESRPGGRELLRTDQRVLYLLGSARRYKIGNESENPLYMVKYKSMEIEELQRSINYSEIDVKKISSQQVTAAILTSFSSASWSRCCLSSSSLTQLRELGFTNLDGFEKSLQDLVLHTDEIISVVTGERNDGTDDIEIDCLRLLRRFIEEIDNVSRQPLTSTQISTLLDTLKDHLSGSIDFQIEAVKCFVGILDKGTEEDKSRVIGTTGIGPSFTQLLCSTNDFIVTTAIGVLSMIATKGTATNIKEVANEVAVLGTSIDFGSMLLSSNHSIINGTLIVMAAVKDHIDVGSKVALLPHLVHIFKSPLSQASVLVNCSLLLSNIFDSEEPPIQKIIDLEVLDIMTDIIKTVDVSGIIYSHLTNAMLNLASKCDLHDFSDLGIGFLKALVDLQESSCDDVRAKAVSILHDMADRNKTVAFKSSPQFGEYNALELVDSDAEDNSDLESWEEAEEVDDETLRLEIEQAAASSESNEVIVPTLEHIDDVTTESPSLMGLPNILLEKVMHYLHVSEVIVLDVVCKRLNQLARSDAFWNMRGRRQIRKQQKNTINIIHFVLSGETEDDYEEIEDHGLVAEAFRNITADLLSRMNHSSSGQDVHFRLRGDTIAYLFEFLEGYMTEKMERAMLAAAHCDRDKVQKDDVALVQNEFHSALAVYGTRNETVRPETQRDIDMALDENGSCHCSIPSFSDTKWCWPEDDCRGVLPAEDGRRIIRRLAYRAGINEMTGDAFTLLETELLYTLGTLLVEAYESSVDLSISAKFIERRSINHYGKSPLVYAMPINPTPQLHDDDDSDEDCVCDGDEEIMYDDENSPRAPVSSALTTDTDMFKIPPPPFDINDEETDSPRRIHTIVPGQIAAAVERRGLTPSKVYGGIGGIMSCGGYVSSFGFGWITSSGLDQEEEWAIEESYYVKPYDEDCFYLDSLIEPLVEIKQRKSAATRASNSNLSS